MKKLLVLMGLCIAVNGFAADALPDFNGGVVVQLDCGDASVLAGIHNQHLNSLAHGLVRSEEDVAAARELLLKAGVSGKVTVGGWDGKMIPFVDNFVNLLVADAGTTASREEILRVLAPLGTAIVGAEKIVKPRPAELDEWPQYLYDQTGNAVSKDSVKPPLGHIQWVGSPRWSRHHETMSSVSACVSGDSKVFYIFDEGSTFSPMLPCHWKLIARDAFNGTILWKRDLAEWVPNLNKLKSGPSTLPRRLVVAGEKLFVTLGIESPVSVLDTATGKTLQELRGTAGTEEIIYDGENLFLTADQNVEKQELEQYPKMPMKEWTVREKHLIRYDLKKDKVVWDKIFDWVAPMTMAGERNKIYFFDGHSVVSLEKEDGSRVWVSAELPVFEKMATFFAPKLVVQDGTVMFAGGEGFKNHKGSRGVLTGVSTEDGKITWTAPNPASGYQSPEDLFIIDGRAWAGDINTHRWYEGEEAADNSTGEFTGVNVATGKIDKRFGHVEAYWFHHRCHMAKATENYLITSRTGTEFIDPKTGEWTLHHWMRGACLYGIMPANGMIYGPQHPCACYIGAKMFGFTTVAPKDPAHITFKHTPEDQRLTVVKKAPAAVASKAAEWPTYRADNARSGTGTSVSVPKGVKWALPLGGKLTPPVVAGGKVVVSLKDKHAVVAVDAANGKPLWRFLPGGMVDSSPTLHDGCAYFGCADGFIYCLDLADGSLVWKFQAAPSIARHMYFERLESVHPVHGNVMIKDGKLYTVAGRSMFTDGGMRFLILDAKTGRKLKEHVMDDMVPGSDEELQMQQEIANMPQALPDLLSTNGKKIFMRYQQFDLEGNRTKIDYTRKIYGTVLSQENAAHQDAFADQKGEDAHLFSGTGFLDDSWWHRTYWVYGKNHASGWKGHTAAGAGGAPTGRILSFDKDTLFAWGRLQRYYRWTPKYEYSLYACDYDHNRKWDVMVPILVRAMLLSGDDLYIMGPDEVVRQSQALKTITADDTQDLMRQQEEMFNGLTGSKLLRVDAKTGKIAEGFTFAGAPEFDGLIGAYGNLYVSMVDGTLQCLGKGGTKLAAIGSSELNGYNKNSAIPPEQKKKGGGKKKK